MELAPALERTVHGKVKPSRSPAVSGLNSSTAELTEAKVITQCEIRKLYSRKNETGVIDAIEVAKSCERRRCGHHPDEYPEPLSTLECLQSIVDPKGSGENKHRYVVASQNQDLRRILRGVRGVPLIYIKRSVMILEPMSDESVLLRARDERSKFRAGIKPRISKRKREDDDDDGVPGTTEGERESGAVGGANEDGMEPSKKAKRRLGPKGPNPLSMMRSKKKSQDAGKDEVAGDMSAKRKRRRKAKHTDDPTANTATDEDGVAAARSGEEER